VRGKRRLIYNRYPDAREQSIGRYKSNCKGKAGKNTVNNIFSEIQRNNPPSIEQEQDHKAR
jgi:hypothetical protein